MKPQLFFLAPALLLAAPLAPAHAAPDAATARQFNAKYDAPLIAAVKAGNAREVGKLLARGANPNARDTTTDSTTALGLAAPLGNLEIIKMLVEAGADMETGNALNQTVLALAALYDRVDAITYLVGKGAKVDNGQYGGLTALMLASAAGSTRAVRALLGLGANVNARDQNNGTPIMFAGSKTIAGQGNLEIAKLLIEAGADVFATTNSGMDAIAMAKKYGLVDVANYLVDRQNLDIRLYNAGLNAAKAKGAAHDNWKTARELLDQGARGGYSSSDGSGFTALIWFSTDPKNFDETTAKRLIAVSAFNAQNKNGLTALHAATIYGNEKMVALLLAAGANVSTVSAEGSTPLDEAQKFPAIAAMLAGAGAKSGKTTNAAATAATPPGDAGEAWAWAMALLGGNPDSKAKTPEAAPNSVAKGPLDELQNNDKTVLMSAALGGNAEQVAQLLKQGATVDIADNTGETALFKAAYGKNLDCIRLLLEAGADVNHRNGNGEPVLVAAAFRGAVSVMRALIEAGADRKDVPAALSQAKDGENKPVVEYLSGLKTP